MKKILVLFPTTPNHRDELLHSACDTEFLFKKEAEVTGQEKEEIVAVFGNPSKEFLQTLPNLEWLQLNSAGVGIYADTHILPLNVCLTNASGAYGVGIAEHMTGLALTLLKKLHRYRDNQRESLWKDEGQVRSILGSVSVMVGLGDIGGEFAKRMKAMGGKTIGVKRTPGEKPDYLDELYTMERLDECLSRADIVFLSLPDTSATRGLFDRERLGKIKDGGILLNAGRGNVLDTEALCDAVESQKLSGAGLDVTEPEPLPVGHRAWTVEDIIITPHVSGGFHLPYTHDRIVDICVENLKSWREGRPLGHVVNRKEGY